MQKKSLKSQKYLPKGINMYIELLENSFKKQKPQLWSGKPNYK